MRKYFAPFAVLATIFLLVACATKPTAEAGKIRESDETHVSSCKLLGTVTGGSSLGGFAAQEAGKRSASAEALNKAAEMGATDIVWQNISGSLNNGASATGRAYKCD
jgi:hypothetical protein